MAKSSVKKSRHTAASLKKQLDALTKRLEVLEDQNFAQQLVIDEIGNRLEKLESAGSWADFWHTPYGGGGAHYPSNPPLITTTSGGLAGDINSTLDGIEITWSDDDTMTKKG